MPNTPTALDIAQALIRCPSVTPHDAGALGLIEGWLKEAGFTTQKIVFSAPNTPDIPNLYARIGTDAPYLVFAGHTDVVPAGDVGAWRADPFSGDVSDGQLWGRGAVDMKGGLAASIAAVLAFVKSASFKGSIGFLITGDEEGPAINGTIKLLEWAKARGEIFDHCILGEPTNVERIGDMMKIGRRGSLTGRLVVHGKQGHVGYPHLADNPVHHIVRLCAALLASPLDDGTQHFDPSSLAITTLDVGNPATNVIPAQAQATFNIRFNDVWTPDTLRQEIETRLARAAGSARYSLTFDPTNAVSFLTQPGAFVDLMAGAIEAETGQRPTLSTTGGTSDARFIQAFCPVVEFGLVGKTMHAVDECTPVDDLAKLTAIYARVLGAYF